MLNFALVLMSGNAVSVPTGKYVTADGTFIYDYSEKNNFRMPVYKRLDIGFKKQIHPNPRVYEKQWWGVNIYNVLNFRNLCGIFPSTIFFQCLWVILISFAVQQNPTQIVTA